MAVVHVELRLGAEEVHVGGVVRLEGAHVAPVVVVLAACEAGPSTFNQGQADPPVTQAVSDSVVESTAPELPTTVQAELAEVAEAAGDSPAEGGDDSLTENTAHAQRLSPHRYLRCQRRAFRQTNP